jgi:1,4-dihydroxy-2-naphthoate polyprenyltransferase
MRSVFSLPSPGAWFRSLRAYSFTATLIPVALAAAIAASQEVAVAWPLFPLFIAGAIFFHGGTNVLNDYWDHLYGVDAVDDSDPNHTISQGVVSPRFMLLSGHGYFIAGIICGLLIALERGLLFMVCGIAGALGGYFYTGARFSFKYKAMGDVLVFLLMGPALVVMGLWTLSGSVVLLALPASLPIAFLVTAILHGNNLRDRESDRRAGVRTVANLLSESGARRFFAFLLLAPYVTAALLAVAGLISPWALASLLTIVPAFLLVRRVMGGDSSLARLPVSCASLHLAFGVLYVGGVALGA